MKEEAIGGHVYKYVRREKCIRIMAGKSDVNRLVVRYRLHGTVPLKLISRKRNESGWTGLIWLRVGTRAGLCMDGNESLVAIGHREFPG
jgi:hypothetical protein